ncbi:hypothetical protein PVAP13_1KG438520 [Panicum virgatum]|uniref:Uncharacterized protein n=1 Tax=Panicum virgatum TaxID=38727 RepID=A0A8T0XMU5_PANVG|nr:hypothetical protein PVAP13_1KG438520 [Panicum virgatum]
MSVACRPLFPPPSTPADETLWAGVGHAGVRFQLASMTGLSMPKPSDRRGGERKFGAAGARRDARLDRRSDTTVPGPAGAESVASPPGVGPAPDKLVKALDPPPGKESTGEGALCRRGGKAPGFCTGVVPPRRHGLQESIQRSDTPRPAAPGLTRLIPTGTCRRPVPLLRLVPTAGLQPQPTATATSAPRQFSPAHSTPALHQSACSLSPQPHQRHRRVAADRTRGRSRPAGSVPTGRYRPRTAPTPVGTDRARLQRRSVATARPVGSATAPRSRFPRLPTGAGRTNASSCSSTPRQASSGTEGAPGGAAGGKRATISAGTSATTTREVVIPSAPIAAGRTAGHGAPMEPMSAPSTRPELQRLPMLPKSCRSTGAWAHRGACSEQASRRRPQGMDTARQAYCPKPLEIPASHFLLLAPAAPPAPARGAARRAQHRVVSTRRRPPPSLPTTAPSPLLLLHGQIHAGVPRHLRRRAAYPSDDGSPGEDATSSVRRTASPSYRKSSRCRASSLTRSAISRAAAYLVSSPTMCSFLHAAVRRPPSRSLKVLHHHSPPPPPLTPAARHHRQYSCTRPRTMTSAPPQ